MLQRAAGRSEPGVVGDVQDPGRPHAAARLGRSCHAWKQRFIADEHLGRRQALRRDRRRLGTGREVVDHMDEAAEADFRRQVAERHVFAKGDKLMLVIDRDDAQGRALAAERHQAVEIARGTVGRRLHAIDAHHQRLAGGYQIPQARGVDRPGRHQIIDHRRQGALGPEDNRGRDRGRPGGQLGIGVEHKAQILRLPLLLLVDIGLHDTEHRRRRGGRRACVQPRGANREQPGPERKAHRQRRDLAPARDRQEQHPRRSRDDQRDPGQTIGANEGGGLRHRRPCPPGLPDQVPGKAREDVASQPFGAGEYAREDHNAGRAADPGRPEYGRRRAPEQRQAAGHQHQRERRHPSLGLGVHQKRLGDPVNANREIADAAEPAPQKRRAQRPRP